jgi:hypothetical protein
LSATGVTPPVAFFGAAVAKRAAPFFSEHTGRSENDASHSQTLGRQLTADCDTGHRFGDLSQACGLLFSSEAPALQKRQFFKHANSLKAPIL